MIAPAVLARGIVTHSCPARAEFLRRAITTAQLYIAPGSRA